MARTFAKTRISPSDLTFGWSGCKRCFWIRYANGVSHQGPFPGIVTSLSAKQEGYYKDKHSRFLADAAVGHRALDGQDAREHPDRRQW